MKARVVCLGLFFAGLSIARAQEASAGVDLRATISGEAIGSNALTQPPRSGAPLTAGYRAILYPTAKINEHWTATAALQSYSSPYFSSEFSSSGTEVESNVLQASLNYSRVSERGSLFVRAGELTTAFGSFPLRYDDAQNALTDVPLTYGYYNRPVSTLGLAGAQIDASRGKWDGRAQFTNSSPANPRGLRDADQYGNLTGGAGYTIRQGFRIGVSAYHGPYLNRSSEYFPPGEIDPSKLPARAGGVDAAWAREHFNLRGEWQAFVFPYTKLPKYRENAGYGEMKWVAGPRWYLAARAGYSSANLSGNVEAYEGAAGFRLNRFQLFKLGYELQHQDSGAQSFEHSVVFQFVTSLHLASFARN